MLEENIKEFVVDSSYVLAFLLPDEKTDLVDRVFGEFQKKNVVLISCYLLPFEVLNALRMAVVRKRITEKKAVRMLSDFLKLGIGLSMIDFKKAFLIAEENDLTFYDASYYALSLQSMVPILTLDREIMALAKK